MVGASCKAYGGPFPSENRAHWPGGDGESSPGGVRSPLQGQWGAIIFGEPGALAWGGRGVLPRGCSEPPARPTGGHLLQRTGRIGLGVWCGVVWCGVVWCSVVWCGVVCRRRCYQKAKGRDVYPRVKVNGLGCVCCVRAVRKCVSLGRGRGSRGDLVSSPLATALIVDLLQHTASLPGGSGQWTSFNALPNCLGAVGSGPPAMHCLTAWGQWAVDLLQHTASLPGGSGQWTSFNALPHCLGAVGSGTPAMHCLTAWGQWAVEPLQCTASLPGGSGQWTSCHALPYCLGGVDSAASAMHCRTAWGQWAVDLLQ